MGRGNSGGDHHHFCFWRKSPAEIKVSMLSPYWREQPNFSGRCFIVSDKGESWASLLSSKRKYLYPKKTSPMIFCFLIFLLM
ncbi:hypothetical protein AXF42_Ash012603 [Apostasia shenzhenica]|uniref:Uncharacterized protein n=1 Tax=Apostasia shenzhenica TaxID=1088818 RepID=A0A2H9ZT45_9ASPA|nr:hypothetical protein AXF42_Ash012603 [Apostasia shenzhenica]